MTMDRREFIKKASLGAAVLAGSGFLVGCNSTDAVAPASAPAKWDMETDIVVAGAGNGGLSAGASAAEEGKKVTVVEISAFLGGGSAWSGGSIHAWGLETWEEYNKYTEGLHDQVLGKTFIETFRKTYIPWLQSNGIPITKQTGTKGPSLDWKMGSDEQGYLKHKAYFDALKNFIEGKGGTVLTQTRVLRLVVDDAGTVCGIQAVKNGEAPIFIKANAVILATGNFMVNKGLMAKYLGPNGDTVRAMAVPYSTGDGMLMAQGVGAMTTGSFNTFSGTMCAITPTPVNNEDPEAYEKARAGDPASLPGLSAGRPYTPGWCSLLYPEDTMGIFVNLEGKRFKDESCPIDAKYPRIPQEIVKQRRGMAFMLADKVIFDKAPGSEAILKGIESEGGQIFVGNTIEELADKLHEAYGLYAGTLVKTINEYNKAIDNGTATDLEVPRIRGHYKFATAPFYAVPTGVSCYHTFGGLAINESAQVLDLQKQPIPNLYACPPVAGGVFREPYTGGIAVAGTFGYIAGKSASK